MLRRLLLSKGGTQLKKPVIEFRDFGFKYDAQQSPTLYNIDLTVYEGEKILICGPSGCGKSTLASCINGLIPQRYFGEKTGKLWDGTIPCPSKPLRIRTRNICGDETEFVC